MDNKEIIEKYRNRLIGVHRATVTIVSVVEIIAYFIFVYLGIEKFSFESGYLWLNVILPICINACAHLVAVWICRSERFSIDFRNASIIYAAFVTTFVVSIFHRDYIVTLCAFVFPIILSAMYNDKKLLKQSLYLALVSLTIAALVLYIEKKLDLTTALNVMVLYGFVAVSYLSGDLSIKFSQSNFALIEEQARINDNLEYEIDLDPMTKLFNKMAFYERLEIAMEKARNDDIESHIAVMDIDDFKKINDECGHDEGDDVLKALAKILKGVCDENDYPCRFGGEEFALILVGKNLEEALERVEVARKEFSALKFDFLKERLSFSCGVTKVNPDISGEENFSNADDLLYDSKKNGKDRITY